MRHLEAEVLKLVLCNLLTLHCACATAVSTTFKSFASIVLHIDISMENKRAIGHMYHRSSYLVPLFTSILLHQMLVLFLMMMVAVYYNNGCIKDIK